jgi:hypothetical protein
MNAIGIDSDVILLAFAFHRDQRQEVNNRFLFEVAPLQPRISIYSVMEILGQLSFNLPPSLLLRWESWMTSRFNLVVVYPGVANLSAAKFLKTELIEQPLGRMQKKMPYLDSLIINLIESAPAVDHFVSWNARHFVGRTDLTVLTPADYLAKAQV